MSKKRNLHQEIDSIFESMQEVYRDCDEQKRKIMATMKVRKSTWEAEDAEEESKLGKLELDAYKLLNDLIDKKIKIIQLHSKIVNTRSETSLDEDNDIIGLNDLEMRALAELAKSENINEISYDLSNE